MLSRNGAVCSVNNSLIFTLHYLSGTSRTEILKPVPDVDVGFDTLQQLIGACICRPPGRAIPAPVRLSVDRTRYILPPPCV